MNGELVVCGACGTLNRVPAERLTQRPSCGRCRKPLFGNGPIAADGAMLERLVNKGTLPVLVDFWAPWCGPCRAMAPAFEAAAGTLEPTAVLAKVNTEAVQEAAARHAIRSIPTMILFRGGREVARQAGATNQAGIVQWAQAALSGR